jgi:hypothetical protein
MKLAGRILTSVLGLGLLWFAVTMALSPELIIPIAKHGEMPQRVDYEPNLTTHIARYATAGLLGFFGLTLAVAPWRKRQEEDETSA